MRTYQQLLAAASFSVAVWVFSGCGSQEDSAPSAVPDSTTIHEFSDGSSDRAGGRPQQLRSEATLPDTQPLAGQASNSKPDGSVNVGDGSVADGKYNQSLPPESNHYVSVPSSQDGQFEDRIMPQSDVANSGTPELDGPVPAEIAGSDSGFDGVARNNSRGENDPDSMAEAAVSAELQIPKPVNRPESSIMINPSRKLRPLQAQDSSVAGRVRGVTGADRQPSVIIRRAGGAVARQGFSNEVIYFATNRAPKESPRATTDPDLYFGATRGALQYGQCEVSIPYQRPPGSLPSPSVLKFEFTQDPARHVVLMQIQLQGDELFWESLRNEIASREQKNLMLFVHGYSASFRDAARRTAQMAYDMNYKGPAMFFSCPAGSETEGFNRWNYTNDLRRADESCEDFITVVEAVAARSGATGVHLVVHSMGNHLVTESLKTMADRRRSVPSAEVVFDAVAMAAPDIDAQEFVNRTADRIRPFGRRFAVYASRHDKALSFSAQLNGWHPLGLMSESSAQLAAKEQFDLIDVSDISGGWFASGHVYYGDMPEVIRDLHGVFMGRSIQSRGLLATSPVLRLVRQASR